MGGRELSHTLLTIFHVFMTNVLLLNYLIAILSTTYDAMKQTGIFKYKVNLFQYCERYMVAFADKDYGEIVLHPPPVSYLAVFLVPFTLHPVASRVAGKIFAILMFWAENTFFISVFLLYSGFLMPFVYLKVLFNILRSSFGMFTLIFFVIVWIIFGMIFLVFFIIRDTFIFMNILRMH